MSRVTITLHGESAEWFREVKRDVEQQRDGCTPSNAELVRLLLHDADL